MRKGWLIAALLFVILLAVLGSGVLKSPSDLPSSPLFMRLDVVGSPILNNEFTLVTTFGLNVGAPYRTGWYDGTIVYLSLPEEVEVVSGPINWTGNIDNQTNKLFTLYTILKITKEGGYTIRGNVVGPTDERGRWFGGDYKTLYIESFLFGYNILPYKPFGTDFVGEWNRSNTSNSSL